MGKHSFLLFLNLFVNILLCVNSSMHFSTVYSKNKIPLSISKIKCLYILAIIYVRYDGSCKRDFIGSLFNTKAFNTTKGLFIICGYFRNIKMIFDLAKASCLMTNGYITQTIVTYKRWFVEKE